MSRFRGAWLLIKNLFGFETLVFVTSGILSIHKQLVTPQRERKLEIASYDPFKYFIFFLLAKHIMQCNAIQDDLSRFL